MCGRSVRVYLCGALHIADDGGSRKSGLVIQPVGTPNAEYSSAWRGGMFLSTGLRNARFWVVDVAEHAAALGEPNAKCPVM